VSIESSGAYGVSMLGVAKEPSQVCHDAWDGHTELSHHMPQADFERCKTAPHSSLLLTQVQARMLV